MSDMQSEKDYFYHCKKFEYNHDALMVYDVSGSIVCLYGKDYYKFSFFRNVDEYM